MDTGSLVNITGFQNCFTAKQDGCHFVKAVQNDCLCQSLKKKEKKKVLLNISQSDGVRSLLTEQEEFDGSSAAWFY